MRLTKKQTYNIALKQARRLKNLYKIRPEELAKITTAIAFIESSFRPKVRSDQYPVSTAKGLMQVNNLAKSDAERWMKLSPASENAMFNADYNMLLGTRYFVHQLNRYNGNVKKAVIAYNQGHYNTSVAGLAYYQKFSEAYDGSLTQTVNYANIGYGLLGASAITGIIYSYKKWRKQNVQHKKEKR